MKIGIITCREIPRLTKSEQLLIPLFAQKDIVAEPVIWNDVTINWNAYDLLIFRSVWDYHLYPEVFLRWLHDLGQKNLKTLNPLETVISNQNKFYLRDLEKAGIRIIPTLFIEKTHTLNLASVRLKGWAKAVIKPAISASAHHTESFSDTDIHSIENRFKKLATTHDFLVQSFMPEIQLFGEVSLVFFNRTYSHAVRKIPKANDFRVQYEHGGQTELYAPKKKIIEAAEKILSLYPGNLLYARIDGIIKNDEFVLMEVELIEPELFFDFREDSRQRFVDAVLEIEASA